MKRIIFKIIPVIITLMLFIVNGFSQIQGGVFDKNKQGIPNALLIAKDSVGNIFDTVRSDKRGFYSFKLLKKGKYNIEAKATGFVSRVFENVEVIKEEPAEKVERDDISSATRLEIVLTPAKIPK